MMSLSISFKNENVMSPMLVRTPSASVTGGYSGWIVPFYMESLASRARQGSTPTTFVFGLNLRVAERVPLEKPPPPTGTTTQSKSFSSSQIQSAQVAAPVIICKSLYGCMKTAPVSLATLLLSFSCSAALGPHSTISAPYPLTAFFLTSGVTLGITMMALRPSDLAMQATACAWFPEE